MKKLIICLFTISLFTACKSDAKTEGDVDNTISKSYDQNDGFITVRGEFIYVAKDNAAVLQTPSQIYGVVVDEKMHELNKQLAAYKKEDTDMIPVTVRVRKFKKEANEEGWENRVEIKEIIKIEEPSAKTDDVIKLGS